MIKGLEGKLPMIDASCFIAETADIIGNVLVEENANIWYNTVVRGDVEPIKVGKNTNVQDLCMLHTSHDFPLTIGDDVTVGHRAIVHGCTIGNRVLVGMGAIILDGAVIEDDVIIGAGSLIPPNKRIPSGSLVIGSPGKIVRSLTHEDLNSIKASATGYVELSQKYK